MKECLLIGSRALMAGNTVQNDGSSYSAYVEGRKDFDLIMTDAYFNEWLTGMKDFVCAVEPRHAHKFKVILKKDGYRTPYEIEIVYDGEKETSNFLLLNNDEFHAAYTAQDKFENTYPCATVEALHAIKESHIIFNIHWDKNIRQYAQLQKLLGDNYIPSTACQELFRTRRKETQNRVQQNTPKLQNKTKEAFFKTKLPYPQYFVHDRVHEIFAHHDRPVYEMMQKEDEEVACSRELFDKLPHLYKIQAVLEEAYVIAMERYVIPTNLNATLAFMKALQRICTNLTSGWFRKFAYDHYLEIARTSNVNYYVILLDAYKNGEIEVKPEFKGTELPQFLR